MAEAHKDWETNLTHVVLAEPIAESDPAEPIKLLEVVEGTIERGIEPLTFAPDPVHVANTSQSSLKSRLASLRPSTLDSLTFPRPAWKLGQELALEVAA